MSSFILERYQEFARKSNEINMLTPFYMEIIIFISDIIYELTLLEGKLKEMDKKIKKIEKGVKKSEHELKELERMDKKRDPACELGKKIMHKKKKK